MRPFELLRNKTVARPADFTNGAIYENNGITLTANNSLSPDGRNSATRILETATTDYHYTRQNVTAYTTGVSYVVEAYIKPINRQWICIDNGNFNYAAWFDTTNNVVGNVGASVTNTKIVALSNGWKYIAIEFLGNGVNTNFTILTASANGTILFLGNTGSGFYIWKARVMIGYLLTAPGGGGGGGGGSRTGIIHANDFELTTFASGYTVDANSGAITRSNAIAAKENSYSARFQLSENDPFVAGSVRAELNLAGPQSDGRGGGQFAQRQHHWIGLATYLDPATYNTSDPEPESIFQWHNQPNFSVGQSWGSYKFQNPYRLQIRNGAYQFILQYDTTKSRSSTSANGSVTINLGATQTGVWVNWVIHMYPDYNNGILEIWKDGVLVVNGNPNQAGNTWYNDDVGPYMKIGIYKWPWDSSAGRASSTVSTRVLYIDALRWGDASSDYNSVAPGTQSVSYLQNRSFEGSTPFAGMNIEALSNGVTQSTSIFTHGSASSKHFIDRSAPGYGGGSSPHRSEIHSAVEEFTFGTDYWIGFNMYLENWANDTETDQIIQWHNVPNFGAGETWGTLKLQTPFSIQIRNNAMEVAHGLMPAGQESNPNATPQIVRTSIGAPASNAWTAWVFHCRWHYQNGHVRVWKNGVLVYEKTGHTYYNDETGPYHKVGIYKWAWALGYPGLVSTRTAYLDNWKITSAAGATYANVDPTI